MQAISSASSSFNQLQFTVPKKCRIGLLGSLPPMQNLIFLYTSAIFCGCVAEYLKLKSMTPVLVEKASAFIFSKAKNIEESTFSMAWLDAEMNSQAPSAFAAAAQSNQ